MNTESDILLLIESLIKKGNKNMVSFKESLISQLKDKFSINTIKTIIKKKLS